MNENGVLETYWRFASERMAMFYRRVQGEEPPWTSDPILQEHRFTNVFRASDRVSQYLIRHVIYNDEYSQDASQVLFRTWLYKIFNRTSTWETLIARCGCDLESFDLDEAIKVLNGVKPVYNNAYLMASVPGYSSPRHVGHLTQLYTECLYNNFAGRVQACQDMQSLYWMLRALPSFGKFLAFQFAIDYNYSEVVNYSENEFTVAGPGAIDGLSKMYPGMDMKLEQVATRALCNDQDYFFDKYGLVPATLYGRKMQLIDCENVLCETSKYTRKSHPDVAGAGGRTSIKQKFEGTREPLETPLFPPKWGLTVA